MVAHFEKIKEIGMIMAIPTLGGLKKFMREAGTIL